MQINHQNLEVICLRLCVENRDCQFYILMVLLVIDNAKYHYKQFIKQQNQTAENETLLIYLSVKKVQKKCLLGRINILNIIDPDRYSISEIAEKDMQY